MRHARLSNPGPERWPTRARSTCRPATSSRRSNSSGSSRLNLVYRDMVGPIVINLSGAPDSAEAEARPPRARRGWRRAESEAKAEGDDGSRVAAAEALNLAARTPVLLSDDPNAWARVSRAMPAIRPQTTHNGGRVWKIPTGTPVDTRRHLDSGSPDLRFLAVGVRVARSAHGRKVPCQSGPNS